MKRIFRKFNLHEGKRGSAITIHIIPNQAEKAFTEVWEDGTLVLTLDGKEVSGKANQQVVKFLAAALTVSSDDIEIVAGKDGPDKIISILNQEANELHNKLMQLIRR